MLKKITKNYHIFCQKKYLNIILLILYIFEKYKHFGKYSDAKIKVFTKKLFDMKCTVKYMQDKFVWLMSIILLDGLKRKLCCDLLNYIKLTTESVIDEWLLLSQFHISVHFQRTQNFTIIHIL